MLQVFNSESDEDCHRCRVTSTAKPVNDVISRVMQNPKRSLSVMNAGKKIKKIGIKELNSYRLKKQSSPQHEAAQTLE